MLGSGIGQRAHHRRGHDDRHCSDAIEARSPRGPQILTHPTTQNSRRSRRPASSARVCAESDLPVLGTVRMGLPAHQGHFSQWPRS